MEKRNISGLRKLVVVGFSIASMLLVLIIWVDNFASSDDVQSDYVRSTYGMPTSEEWHLTLTAAPQGQGKGEGQGGGQGGSEEHESELTPSPTFDIQSWTPDPNDSDEVRDE